MTTLDPRIDALIKGALTLDSLLSQIRKISFDGGEDDVISDLSPDDAQMLIDAINEARSTLALHHKFIG